MTVELIPVVGIAEVSVGDDVAVLVGGAIEANLGGLRDRDVVVVASKILSKAEGRRVLVDPEPSPSALEVATLTGFDPGQVELILSESRAVLRARPGVLVVETRAGYVCANAGVDRSNAGPAGGALLLPADCDAAAAEIRTALAARFGVELAVLVSDTFGRPFRHGLVNVALGVAGMDSIRDYRGQRDGDGYLLKGTELAVADELCSAAELVMNKLDGVPVAVVRGYQYAAASGSGRQLLRDPATDHFR